MADTNKIERPLLRMATAILDSLRQAIVEPQLPVFPQREWERTQQLRRQLLIARQRGWQGAAEELLWDFKGSVRILSRYVDACCREIDSLPDESAKPMLNLRQMYDELDALQTEFGEFDCDLKQHTISIVTDPIALEEIDLGPFQIVLHWDRLTQPRAYEVVALEPNAATSHDDVPHPHVQGQALCEGDGKAAIRSALQQGRLCDFFLLVTQILQTYNAGSAYVRLEQWTGGVEIPELVPEPTSPPADIAIQPDGVGEVVVPARPRPDRSGWVRDFGGRRLLADRRRAARQTKLHLRDGSLRRCRRRRLLRFAS